MRIRTKQFCCGIDGCKKRFSSTDAKRKHIRRAHEEWEDYQRPSYWANLYELNEDEYGRSAIKLPPEERKRRAQSRRDEEREQRRLHGAGTFKSGKGGRPPKPVRTGRPSASKALVLESIALESINEPNVRQLTRALMEPRAE